VNQDLEDDAIMPERIANPGTVDHTKQDYSKPLGMKPVLLKSMSIRQELLELHAKSLHILTEIQVLRRDLAEFRATLTPGKETR
jgi:hypothetical protein